MARKRTKKAPKAKTAKRTKAKTEPSPTPPAAPSPAEPLGSRRWIAYAAVAAVVAVAFGRGVGFGLLDGWDDGRFILDNPLVSEPSFEHLTAIFSAPHFEAYHPLHLLSYWIDVPWLGTDGPGLHAVNLVLWVLTGVAVLEASWALGLGFWGGLISSLILLAHPSQVEAVTWVTGRKDILALGFSALAVLAHCRSARPFDAWRMASVAAFAAAGLSKTTALPLPLVLIAADVWLRKRPMKSAALAQAPALLIALGLGVATVLIWQDNEMLRGRELAAGQHVQLVLATLTHTLGAVLWPSDLSPLYPIERDGDFGLVMAFGGVLLIGAAIATAARARNHRALFCLVSFVILWLPVSNVLPLYFQWADRYLSLPLWPLALGVGLLVDAFESEGARWPRVAAAVLVAALAGRTVQYVGAWRDPVTLFGHAAATQPESFYAWLNLGHARAKRGQLASAAAAYERAVETQSLLVAHAALFRVTALRDERERGLDPRADEYAARFAPAAMDADALRVLGSELADNGYRRAVMLALDYSFATSPLPDDTLERAALVQIQRGHDWLARYYVSRLSRPPIHTALQDRYFLAPEAGGEAPFTPREPAPGATRGASAP